jgi:cytochrome c oxidase subunit 2
VIRVVGRQFDWSFEYPGGRVSDTLHLPAGRRLELRLTSPDVVHCLYIPALRVKCDAVPGLETKVQFSTSREGPFDVACSEFCGVRHSQHVTTGLVQSEQEFEQWLAGGAKR